MAAMDTPRPPIPPATSAGRFPLLAMAGDFLLAAALMLLLMSLSMVGWGLLDSLQAGPGAARPDPWQSPSEVFIAVSGGLSMLIAGLLLVRMRAFTRHPPVDEPAALRDPRTWRDAVLTGLALVAASALLTELLSLAGDVPDPGNMKLLEALYAANPLWLILVAVVLAPLAEELLFRRILFGRLLAAGRPWIGLVATSLLFGLLHEPPLGSDHPWLMHAGLLGFYALMGAAFAWLHRRTGTWWAAVAAHAVNNAVAALFLAPA